ncbi:MAG: DUF1634 domain-containing protein [Verrucomicrobia bacterium]|nr:DUF1634 domain-containing protein [Verrucomicrobiota bacterium]
MKETLERRNVEPEQIVYARTLEWATKISIAVLVLTGSLYFSGILPGRVPVNRMSDFWGMKAREYLLTTQSPRGWAVLYFMDRGDCAVTFGIMCLALVTVAGFIGLTFSFFRKGDKVYALMAALQVIVILLAASGLLTGHYPN